MDNHHKRRDIKNKLFASPPTSDFDQDAKDGWDNIGQEHWEKIHQKLDTSIDEIVSKETTQPIHIKKRRFSSIPYGIAAMILIILGLSIRFIYNDEPQNVQLFEAYYQPLNGPEDTFRSEEKLNELEAKARYASDAYDDLEYKKAIAFYSELLKESPNNSKYTLFLGLSYMNEGKYDDAILLYNGYTPKNESYDEDIQWYLALAHLRKGEIQTSKLLLQNIANNSVSYYSETATELVAKMSRLK